MKKELFMMIAGLLLIGATFLPLSIGGTPPTIISSIPTPGGTYESIPKFWIEAEDLDDNITSVIYRYEITGGWTIQMVGEPVSGDRHSGTWELSEANMEQMSFHIDYTKPGTYAFYWQVHNDGGRYTEVGGSFTIEEEAPPPPPPPPPPPLAIGTPLLLQLAGGGLAVVGAVMYVRERKKK